MSEIVALPDPHNKELRRQRLGLLVHNRVKYLALHLAATRKLSTGEPRFTRVSPEFIDRIESKLHVLLSLEIAGQPSKGRTLR